MAKINAKRRILKIVVTGPESSGKSTLAAYLHQQINCVLVEEQSRLYLESLDRPYLQEDLIKIARQQYSAEMQAMTNNNCVICDTSIEVIKIWYEFKYGLCPSEISSKLEPARVDLYLLCAPDLPWVLDPLRESPNDRTQLFRLYKDWLESEQVPYLVIQGEQSTREKAALDAVNSLRRTN